MLHRAVHAVEGPAVCSLLQWGSTDTHQPLENQHSSGKHLMAKVMLLLHPQKP